MSGYNVSLKRCFSHNWVPGLLFVAGALMSFHYRQVIDMHMGCPVTVAAGPSSTRKTTLIKAAPSLFGLSMSRHARESSQINDTFGIDDLAKKKATM